MVRNQYANGQLQNCKNKNHSKKGKKGDISKLGNWRPISEQFFFRLRKYIDKITAVGQKGYSNTKMGQEVVISIIDEIQCSKSAEKRALWFP